MSRSLQAPTLSPDKELRLARSVAEIQLSGLREVMDLVTRPGILSLAVGLPAADLFPMTALAEASAHLLATDPGSLQYAPPFKPLKAQVAELMAMRGVRVQPEQIFLTTGSQQAMDLLCRLLVDPGAQVMLEETVYDGIQLAVKRQDVEILTVSTDPQTGIDVDQVESLLARGARPCLLYVITEGHNPLGVSMSVEKRHRLVELARTYGLPILEDDAYGFLYYGDKPEPPLRALDEKWVFYLGSFSKVLAPALRAGWAVVPEELVPRLSMLKHAADLDTPSFSFRTVSAFLEAGGMPQHLEQIRAEYRRRRDAMLSALEEHLPTEVRWNRPSSGMFVWVELPQEMDATVLLRTAVETEQVAFSPGSVFASKEGGHARHCLRLSFANNPPPRIEEAIRRLGRVIKASGTHRRLRP
ncbi:MAG TPA: PLP-dependent aminotransferase family protein [Thermoanaerobaculia bacterium]|jgi:2-aminoadipate transaminase|nr:PLP-dependent aminotransferase family protein [Thermoanaerobaculia bacterium]